MPLSSSSYRLRGGSRHAGLRRHLPLPTTGPACADPTTTAAPLAAAGSAPGRVRWRCAGAPGWARGIPASRCPAARRSRCSRTATRDVLAAFDAATGKEAWRVPIAEAPSGPRRLVRRPDLHAGRSRARACSPSARAAQLVAVDLATGRVSWRVDVAERDGARKPHYGFGSSPVVAGGVLVAQVGGDKGRAIAGFDPATGARRWTAGDDVVQYQSPVADDRRKPRDRRRGGRRQALRHRPRDGPDRVRARARRRAGRHLRRQRGAGARGGRPRVREDARRQVDDVPDGRGAGRERVGADPVDGARAAHHLRRARVPRRPPLRHERPHHLHLRGRGHGRGEVALARARRRLPHPGRRRHRVPDQGAHAARGARQPAGLDGARAARGVQGPRLDGAQRRRRLRLRAQPGRAGARRLEGGARGRGGARKPWRRRRWRGSWRRSSAPPDGGQGRGGGPLPGRGRPTGRWSSHPTAWCSCTAGTPPTSASRPT